MLARWEHYEDGGTGIGVRGFGDSESDAFEQAALALTAAVTDPGSVAAREVWIDGPRLSAHAWGEPVNPERHALRLELKRPRPHTPRVARHGEGWIAQAIMDF